MLPFERVEPSFLAAGGTRSGAHRPGGGVIAIATADQQQRRLKSWQSIGTSRTPAPGRGAAVLPPASSSSSPPRTERRSAQRAMSPNRQTVRISDATSYDPSSLPSGSSNLSNLSHQPSQRTLLQPSNTSAAGVFDSTASDGCTTEVLLWSDELRRAYRSSQDGPTSASLVSIFDGSPLLPCRDATPQPLWHDASPRSEEQALLPPAVDPNDHLYGDVDYEDRPIDDQAPTEDGGVTVRDYMHVCSEIKTVAMEREFNFPRLEQRCCCVLIRPPVLQVALKNRATGGEGDGVVCAWVAKVVRRQCAPSCVRVVVSSSSYEAIQSSGVFTEDASGNPPPLVIDSRGVLFINCSRLATHKVNFRLEIFAEDVTDIHLNPSTGKWEAVRSESLFVDVLVGNISPGATDLAAPAIANVMDNNKQAQHPSAAAKKKLHEALHHAAAANKKQDVSITPPRTVPVMPLHAFRFTTDATSSLDLMLHTLLTQAIVLMLRSPSDLCERQMLRRGVRLVATSSRSLLQNTPGQMTIADAMEQCDFGSPSFNLATEPPLTEPIPVELDVVNALRQELPDALQRFEAEGGMMSLPADAAGNALHQPAALRVLDQLIPLLFAQGGDAVVFQELQEMVSLRVELCSRRALGFGFDVIASATEALPLMDLVGGGCGASSEGAKQQQPTSSTASPSGGRGESSSSVNRTAVSPHAQLQIIASLLQQCDETRSNALVRTVVESAHALKHVGSLSAALGRYRSALCLAMMQHQPNAIGGDAPQHDQVASRLPFNQEQLSFALPLLRVIGDLYGSLGQHHDAVSAYEIGRSISDSKARVLRAEESSVRRVALELQAAAFDASIAAVAALSATLSSSSGLVSFHRCCKTLDGLVRAPAATMMPEGGAAGGNTDHRRSQQQQHASHVPSFTGGIGHDSTSAAAAAGFKFQCIQSAVDTKLLLAYSCIARDSLQQSTKLLEEAEALMENTVLDLGARDRQSVKVLHGNVAFMRAWICAMTSVQRLQRPETEPSDSHGDDTTHATANERHTTAQEELSNAKQFIFDAVAAYRSARCPLEDICVPLVTMSGFLQACSDYEGQLVASSTWSPSSLLQSGQQGGGRESRSEMSPSPLSFSHRHDGPTSSPHVAPATSVASVPTNMSFTSLAASRCTEAAIDDPLGGMQQPTEDSPPHVDVPLPPEDAAQPTAAAPTDDVPPARNHARMEAICKKIMVNWHPLMCTAAVCSALESATEWRKVTMFSHTKGYHDALKQIQLTVHEVAKDVLEDCVEPSQLDSAHLLRFVWAEALTTAALLVFDADTGSRCIGIAGDTMESIITNYDHHQHTNPATTTAAPSSTSMTSSSSCWHIIQRESGTLCRRIPNLAANCFTTLAYHEERAVATGKTQRATSIQRFLRSATALNTQHMCLALMKEVGVFGGGSGSGANSGTHHGHPQVHQRFKGELACFFLDLAEIDYSRGNWMGCLDSCGRALRLADERNLLYLLGDLFRPSFVMTQAEVEDRLRLTKDRRVSSSSGLVLALSLYTTARVHEAAGNLGQALQVFSQSFAALELLHLLRQPVAIDALIGCARSAMLLGQLGDALMYAEHARELFETHHAQYGAYKTQKQLVELTEHLNPVIRVIHDMTEERQYRLTLHDPVYTTPMLNGFPLYI